MRSERKKWLLDQLEMQLKDAKAGVTKDEFAAERSARRAVVDACRPFP